MDSASKSLSENSRAFSNAPLAPSGGHTGTSARCTAKEAIPARGPSVPGSRASTGTESTLIKCRASNKRSELPRRPIPHLSSACNPVSPNALSRWLAQESAHSDELRFPLPACPSHQNFLFCLGHSVAFVYVRIEAPHRKPVLSTVILPAPKLSSSLPSWIITISVQISCNSCRLKKKAGTSLARWFGLRTPTAWGTQVRSLARA